MAGGSDVVLARALGLPQADVADALRMSREGSGYSRFPLPKQTGGRRWIEAPRQPLKRVQRRLLETYLYRLRPHPAAHGFVPGRSVVTHASLHVGRRYVLCLDLRDFFHSTRAGTVSGTLAGLQEALPISFEDFVCLLVDRDRLPQGAPTSPHLANLAFLSCDERLTALARNAGLSYSRYADDLAFSGTEIPPGFLKCVRETARDGGYTLAAEKTRFMGNHARQLVTGLVVNERLTLPREARRRLRACIHDAERRGLAVALERGGTRDPRSIEGILAFSMQVDPISARKALRQLAALAEAEY